MRDASCVSQGWTYSGQPYAPWGGRRRGQSATKLRPHQLITCIQNHDQIGNRAFGTRLSEEAGIDRFALAAMLVLFLPTTPLIFMGQEWAATTPFLYFTDHEGDVGTAVTKGRREEFQHFRAFSAPGASDKIPDPQAYETFAGSKLLWSQRDAEPHRGVLALHRAMLRLRRSDPVLSARCRWDQLDAFARGNVLDVVRRHEIHSRGLILNFGADPMPIELSADAHVLLAWGGFDGRTLDPLSAILVASR
jgi:maltooligosyltrehalose trehalohydrolase